MGSYGLSYMAYQLHHGRMRFLSHQWIRPSVHPFIAVTAHASFSLMASWHGQLDVLAFTERTPCEFKYLR